jgi:pyrimidine deaminase RibD-like protein
MKITELVESSNYEIHNLEKLDRILVKLCEMVIEHQQRDSKYYGMVAACVLDPDNNMAAAVNYPKDKENRVHAERAAMELYISQYGSSIPEGSIIITTLSPCNEHSDVTADGRFGESCTELINDSTVHKVYCGYMDPTQGDDEHDERTFTLEETRNPAIRSLCKKFADTFLKNDLDENFADGRNPQDKGDSKRHGINTKASVSSLRKTAHQGGRKGQLAHWLANMKAGRAKKNK